MWEATGEKILKIGGKIMKNARVSSVKLNGNRAVSVGFETPNGHMDTDADYVLSSMPVKDLIAGMNGGTKDAVPADVKRIAAGLPYRDYMTLGVLVKKLKIKNNTNIKTPGNIIPDCWIYVQDRNVKMGRIQIYNNWSPYLVKDNENTVWLGLEYFVSEGDEFWSMSEEEFSEYSIGELIRLGIIDSVADVIDTHMEKVKKAYPAYFDTYNEMSTLTEYLSGIENLYCIGRNGQHRYNNMDHSMVTAFEAVKCIISGNMDKSAVWNVNTEKEYHEEKQA
jgi:protoporphyrinogen oxidase